MIVAHDVRWDGAGWWHCRTCNPDNLLDVPGIPGTFDKRPVCPNDKEAISPCKNCGQPTHPNHIHKYGGYCLDCSNAGVPELRERIEELEAEVKAGASLTAKYTDKCMALEAALKPFDRWPAESVSISWGTILAWIVEGAEACGAERDDGVAVAKLMVAFRVRAAKALEAKT